MAAHSKKRQSQAEHSQGPRHGDGRDPLSLWWVLGFTMEAGPDKGEDQVVMGADQPTKDAVNQKKKCQADTPCTVFSLEICPAISK